MVFRFHMKSGGFQVKSTQNLINSDVSTKTIQFDECRRGAMTLDFMKSGAIAPSMHPPKLKSFCWNIWIYKVLGGFHLKSAGFHGEICRISKLWAFVWWSSIGLSIERPISRILYFYFIFISRPLLTAQMHLWAKNISARACKFWHASHQ